MRFWPVKHIQIESNLKKEKLHSLLENSIDQDNSGIYWGKRFSKRFLGKLGEEHFRIRPVVPYWNISPLEMKGQIKEVSREKNAVDVKITCPYLRIVIPLAILAIVLFFLNLALKDQAAQFIINSSITLAAAYLLVNIPYQIQSIWSIKDINRKINGKVKFLK